MRKAEMREGTVEGRREQRGFSKQEKGEEVKQAIAGEDMLSDS